MSCGGCGDNEPTAHADLDANAGSETDIRWFALDRHLTTCVRAVAHLPDVSGTPGEGSVVSEIHASEVEADWTCR